MRCLIQRSPIAVSSDFEKTLPTGLCGVLRTIILVLGVMAASSSAKSMVQSAAEELVVAPSGGGCSGTYFIEPPGISIFERYWSKKGWKGQFL